LAKDKRLTEYGKRRRKKGVDILQLAAAAAAQTRIVVILDSGLIHLSLFQKEKDG
jgi:hypothetical protein